VTKSWISQRLWNYMWDFVDLELHFTNTLWNAKVFYVSNVDLDEWNNLGILDISSWDHLGFQKLAYSSWNFKIQNLSGPTLSNAKLTSAPNVDLDEFDKLCIHDFCSWDHLGFGQTVVFKKSKVSFEQTWSKEALNDLKCKNLEYKDCRSHQETHLIYISFYYLEKVL